MDLSEVKVQRHENETVGVTLDGVKIPGAYRVYVTYEVNEPVRVSIDVYAASVEEEYI